MDLDIPSDDFSRFTLLAGAAPNGAVCCCFELLMFDSDAPVTTVLSVLFGGILLALPNTLSIENKSIPHNSHIQNYDRTF